MVEITGCDKTGEVEGMRWGRVEDRGLDQLYYGVHYSVLLYVFLRVTDSVTLLQDT